QGPMTGAPGRTPTLSRSSGGWGRASGLRVFGAALLPPELHRNEQETLVGVEPTSRDFADRRLASRPQDHSEPAVGLEPTSSALRGRGPVVEHRRHLVPAASVGVEPTRPRFRAPAPSRGPGQKFRASGGTRTCTRPFTGGVLDPPSCTGVANRG